MDVYKREGARPNMEEMSLVKKAVIVTIVSGYIVLLITASISLGKTGTEDIYPNCSVPLKEIVQVDMQFGSWVPIVFGFIVYCILGNTEDGCTGNTSPEKKVINIKYIEKCSLNTYGIILIVVGAISIHIYDEAKHTPNCFDELKSTPGGLQSSIAKQDLLLLAQVTLAYGIWNILVGSVGVSLIVYDTIKYVWYDDSPNSERLRRYSSMNIEEHEHSNDDSQQNHNMQIDSSTKENDPAKLRLVR